jgi:hypothetical protein
MRCCHEMRYAPSSECPLGDMRRVPEFVQLGHHELELMTIAKIQLQRGAIASEQDGEPFV